MKMKAASSKDYFAIVSIEPTAAPEEIRKAYLDRAREIHPDRFDLRTQPPAWRRANDALAKLNEACAALRDSDIRASDEPGEQPAASPPWSSGWDRAAADSESQDAFAFDLGEVTAGEAAYGDLPRATRERLKARQAGLVSDQLQIRCRPHLLNYAVIGVTLCWFVTQKRIHRRGHGWRRERPQDQKTKKGFTAKVQRTRRGVMDWRRLPAIPLS